MKEAIEAREVITVDAAGVCLRGTYHKPADSPADQKNRVGILFLGSGVLPRAAHGDAAVYWAASLAIRGYFSFRFDLPGIGDSDGDFLMAEMDYQSHVNGGAFGPVVSGLANQLVERFNLSGVIVAGHCAGGVTSLYAAAGNDRIKGLILLDPYFHVQQASEVENALVRWHTRIIKELVMNLPEQSRVRAVGMKMLSILRSIYRRVSQKRVPVLRKTLPGTANLPLIRCARQLVSTGLGMLILRSPSLTPKLGEFDYISYLQADDRERCMSVKQIQGATHAFAERRAKEAIREYTEQWMSASFPLTARAAAHRAEHHSAELADAF